MRIIRLLVFFLCLAIGERVLAASLPRWMSLVPDSVRFCRLAVPGTHDAATGEGVHGLFGALAKTQDCGLRAQFDSGVRAFDLRPALDSQGRLVICHGSFRTKVTFDEAMDIFVKALSDNPSESVVVLMRNEGANAVGNSSWAEQVRRSLGRNVLKSRLVPFRADLTVGEMRGKILVISRNAYSGPTQGGYIAHWPGNKAQYTATHITGADGARANVLIQDYFDSESTDDKFAAVERLAAASARTPGNNSASRTRENNNNNVWIINYTAGYQWLGISINYRRNAKTVNSRTANLLRQKTSTRGIFFMDYAATTPGKGSGQVLTDAIVDCNL